MLMTPSTSRSSGDHQRNSFKCETCLKLFSTKGNLSRHVQAMHVGGQMFPCPTCGKEFKRKDDRTTHMRVHTGEKPYKCLNPGCGKRFVRVSDLRSHERTHDANAKTFVCTHPGCGKSFTRPYDLRKHVIHQHHSSTTPPAERRKGGGPVAISDTPTTNCNPKRSVGASRNIPSPLTATEDSDDVSFSRKRVRPSPPRQQHHQPSVPTTKPYCRTEPGSKSDNHGQVNADAGCNHRHLHRSPEEAERHHVNHAHAAAESTHASTTMAIDRLPQPTPTSTKLTSASTAPRYRKRVRCDAHEHHGMAHGRRPPLPRPATTSALAAIVSRNPGLPHGGGRGACHVPPDGVAGPTGEARAHVHGASCGHVAILHDKHVDFLMKGGQLECFDGKEKTREGWVSHTNEGEGDAGCACVGSGASTDDGKESGTSADVHWDGVRPDQPRGNCMGDSHGPQCGHDVIHHAGHVDYVVNGRLIHPVVANDGLGSTFEDHGAIRALDDDFVTFYETLDVLSLNADKAIESFCDICDGQTGR